MKAPNDRSLSTLRLWSRWGCLFALVLVLPTSSAGLASSNKLSDHQELLRQAGVDSLAVSTFYYVSVKETTSATTTCQHSSQHDVLFYPRCESPESTIYASYEIESTEFKSCTKIDQQTLNCSSLVGPLLIACKRPARPNDDEPTSNDFSVFVSPDIPMANANVSMGDPSCPVSSTRQRHVHLNRVCRNGATLRPLPDDSRVTCAGPDDAIVHSSSQSSCIWNASCTVGLDETDSVRAGPTTSCTWGSLDSRKVILAAQYRGRDDDCRESAELVGAGGTWRSLSTATVEYELILQTTESSRGTLRLSCGGNEIYARPTFWSGVDWNTTCFSVGMGGGILECPVEFQANSTDPVGDVGIVEIACRGMESDHLQVIALWEPSSNQELELEGTVNFHLQQRCIQNDSPMRLQHSQCLPLTSTRQSRTDLWPDLAVEPSKDPLLLYQSCSNSENCVETAAGSFCLHPETIKSSPRDKRIAVTIPPSEIVTACISGAKFVEELPRDDSSSTFEVLRSQTLFMASMFIFVVNIYC